VAGIRVPPFRTEADYRTFVRMLAVHVALLDEGGVSPTTFALLEALETAALPGGRPPDAVPAMVWQLAVRTFLPVAWTPHGLAEVIGWLPDPWQFHTREPGRLQWEVDPRFDAVRGADGRWTVLRHERGDTRTYAEPVDDDAMVLFLLGERRAFPAPFGRKVDDSYVDLLPDGATSAREAFARHAGLPYLSGWG
jgi:hypothetical protein